MKKRERRFAKRMAALSLAGAIALTGCGGQSDRAPALEEYIQESPSDSGQGNMTGASESLPAPAGSAEKNGGNAGSSKESAGVSAAEAQSGAANAAADVAESEYYDYARGGAADEWKMEGIYEESAIKAPEGYLGSVYDYGDDYMIPENNEEYSEWQEKGFVNVMREPLSTFAADVDTASYSNLRRLIREGWGLESLPEGAARIEEMLNYFSYDYEEPMGQEPFGVTTQLGRCPWNEEAELLMIGLKTQSIDYSLAPASNLVFLLDVSGSMGEPDKLPLLQESFATLTDNLS